MKKLLWVLLVIIFIYLGALFWFSEPYTNLQFDLNEIKKIPLKVDRDFLWGSATSAHQVEGHSTNNNWYQFESSVDHFGRSRILNSQKAGAACDEWNRYREDIQLMKAISLNAYRFSVEWSKIEPEKGKFDENVLRHYVQMIDELRNNGIEPMLTLHHFTNPIWFEEKGAFMQDSSPDIFAQYVRKVVEHLGPKIKFWCIINEPSVYALNGYFLGIFPPAEKDLQKAAIVLRNILRTHSKAYSIIKKQYPQAQIGMAVSIFIFDPPSKWNLLDVIVAHLINKNMNNSILEYLTKGKFNFNFPGLVREEFQDNIKNTFDFIGLNYYTRFFKRLNPFSVEKIIDIKKPSPQGFTDMNWEIYPEGLYRALKMIQSYTSKPIYITENGIADDNDFKRSKFIENHLLIMNKAISEGLNIKGYFYWSLIDNWEWAYGFEKRFGLYQVDFKTQERTLRNGSRKYPEMIKQFQQK